MTNIKNRLAIPVTDRNNKNRCMPLAMHVSPLLFLRPCSTNRGFDINILQIHTLRYTVYTANTAFLFPFSLFFWGGGTSLNQDHTEESFMARL